MSLISLRSFYIRKRKSRRQAHSVRTRNLSREVANKVRALAPRRNMNREFRGYSNNPYDLESRFAAIQSRVPNFTSLRRLTSLRQDNQQAKKEYLSQGKRYYISVLINREVRIWTQR